MMAGKDEVTIGWVLSSDRFKKCTQNLHVKTIEIYNASTI